MPRRPHQRQNILAGHRMVRPAASISSAISPSIMEMDGRRQWPEGIDGGSTYSDMRIGISGKEGPETDDQREFIGVGVSKEGWWGLEFSWVAERPLVETLLLLGLEGTPAWMRFRQRFISVIFRNNQFPWIQVSQKRISLATRTMCKQKAIDFL